MAGAIFFILRILGTVLLAVLVLVLIILLIVLFVPVRYSFGGEVRDPEGSTEPLHLDPAKDVSLGGEVSWLMGLVRGKASYEGAFQIEIRVFGRRLDVQKLLKKKAKRQEKEPSGEKKVPETFEEKLERILTRIETIHARLEDTFYVMGTKCGVWAREKMVFCVHRLLGAILPSQWNLTGVLGLGDPARSAGVLSIQGFLYPITAGRVTIGTDYELYRYDLKGLASGSFRVISYIRFGLSLLLSKDVRKVLMRIKRGPLYIDHRRRAGSRKTENNRKAA